MSFWWVLQTIMFEVQERRRTLQFAYQSGILDGRWFCVSHSPLSIGLLSIFATVLIPYTKCAHTHTHRGVLFAYLFTLSAAAVPFNRTVSWNVRCISRGTWNNRHLSIWPVFLFPPIRTIELVCVWIHSVSRCAYVTRQNANDEAILRFHARESIEIHWTFGTEFRDTSMTTAVRHWRCRKLLQRMYARMNWIRGGRGIEREFIRI